MKRGRVCDVNNITVGKGQRIQVLWNTSILKAWKKHTIHVLHKTNIHLKTPSIHGKGRLARKDGKDIQGDEACAGQGMGGAALSQKESYKKKVARGRGLRG